MIFRKQLCAHNPPISVGDCHRTALGCLLDVEPQDVPHFAEIYWNEEKLQTFEEKRHVREWLEGFGVSEVTYGFQCHSYEDIRNLMKLQANVNGEDIVYMLIGKSNIGNHVVICRGAEFLWDPSPSNDFIVAPVDDCIWFTHLVPSFTRYNP